MDKDVERHLERLCIRYLEAQAAIETVRPVQAITGREARQARGAVVDAVTQLQERRKGAAASLVKLAYVRGKRGIQPEAHLDEEDLAKIADLQQSLDIKLRRLEVQTLLQFRNHMRRLQLGKTLRQFDYPAMAIDAVEHGSKQWPLEQQARASLLDITTRACSQGRSSARPHDAVE